MDFGYITGHEIGDTTTNSGLELLRGIRKDIRNYITKSPYEKILRSSTIYYEDSSNIPIYSITINYNITNTLSVHKELATFINMDAELEEAFEYFNSNVDGLLDHLIMDTFKKIRKSID